MSDGFTHLKATVSVCSLMGGASFFCNATGNHDLGFALLVATVGVARTAFVNPDLDVDNGNISHFILRAYSDLLERLWGIWRLPYSGSIKHRSRLSHGFVVGTLIRFAYSAFPPSIVFIFDIYIGLREFGYIFPASFIALFTFWVPLVAFLLITDKPFYFVYFVAGSIVSDAVHIIMDRL